MRIGIDLGGTKIEVVALDETGTELVRRRIDTPRDDYRGTIGAIAGLVAGVEAELGQTGTVGVSMPGAISPATGLVKNANSTWLIGQRFDRDLDEALGRTVRCENDANCMAVSEAVDGAGADGRVVFGVIIGTGVGGGVVVDRQPVRGANAVGGEWGHNPLPWPRDDERPGPDCYCGLKGCIETFLSGPGFQNDYARSTGRSMKAPDIVAAAEAGDAEAEAALQRYEDRLARGLATVINLLDPDVIVLAGGMSNIKRLYTSVPATWERYAFSDRVDTRLRPPVHGDSSGVRGAAWLWPQQKP
ncbi:MAG: ROK family protein [Alphaproteobacteria bacterium]